MTLASQTKEEPGRLRLLIGEEWVDSQTSDYRDVYNPAAGEVIGRVPFSTHDETDRAVEAAARAFEKWRNVPIIERVKFLFKLKERMEVHQEELARLNTRNHGKTLDESRGDLKRTIENVDVAIGTAYTLAKGETLDQVSPGIDISLSKEPLGVFAIVCPFNFPLMIPFWFLPYAIVLGDTLVIKPSEITPLPMQRVAEIIHDEVGLPAGVVNLVHGGKESVESLIANRTTRGVTFVGSTPVAKEVYRLAGEHGKRAISNGGAKNSIVVMPDADVDKSLQNIIGSFFGNTGQRCLAGSNLVPVGEIRAPLVGKFAAAARALRVGDGSEPGTDMGPLVSARARSRAQEFVEIGIGEGARAVSDGRGVRVSEHPNGFFLGPSVLDDARPDMRIAKEEIFGPVATVIPTADIDEAIEVVNQGTNFGNMACIYTTSGRNAREFRTRVDAGNVGINLGVAAPPAYFPFGGRRDSFYGTLHAQIDTIDFFTDKKITIAKW